MFSRSLFKAVVKAPIINTTVRRAVSPCSPLSASLPLGYHFIHTSKSQNQELQTQTESQTQTATATPVASGVEVPDLTPLKYETDLYASIKIHNRPYLVTKGDEVILPFHMKHAEIGDVLNFNDVTTIGSRNYTYNQPSIDPSFFNIKGVVLEKTKKPMYVKEITKRRNRRVRHVQVKHDITIVRISDLEITI
ncbi:unnamed protein product [[Candida] boidinii]|nr:hypothetical protein B5S33_g558 [[Candida] boidinii]GMF13388.1 unnamed protein product [[Candida] boidinii]